MRNLDTFVSQFKANAAALGLTPAEYADQFNRITPEQIGRILETLPTDVLEVAVRFESMGHQAVSR